MKAKDTRKTALHMLESIFQLVAALICLICVKCSGEFRTLNVGFMRKLLFKKKSDFILNN